MSCVRGQQVDPKPQVTLSELGAKSAQQPNNRLMTPEVLVVVGDIYLQLAPPCTGLPGTGSRRDS